MNNVKSNIITSYKLLNWLQKKCPNRTIIANPYCPDDHLYFFRKGHVVLINTANGDMSKPFRSLDNEDSAFIVVRQFKNFIYKKEINI